MFKCGDTVIYGTSGAYKITNEIEKDYLGKNEICFVLEPVFGGNMKIYLPKNNTELSSKMRFMIAKPQLLSLIKNLKSEGEKYITNDNARKEAYQGILKSGDQKRIAGIIKTLHNKRTEQLNNKKRLHQCDERMLREAEKLLYDEIAFVLDISHEDAAALILENK